MGISAMNTKMMTLCGVLLLACSQNVDLGARDAGLTPETGGSTNILATGGQRNVVARSDRNESTNAGVLAINDRHLGSVASLADETEDSLPTAQAPSELSRQVAEYHAAVDGLNVNPALAIERLSAYRSHWPKSSLMHEVDLRSIEALVKLGRRNEAANAARSFLQRYPGSPRAPEMRALAHANGVE